MLRCWRKSAPRIRTETGLSWNNQEQFQETKSKEVILEPEQDTEEPFAVSRLIPEDAEKVRAGNSKTDAPVSTRNRLPDNLSCR